MRCESGVMVLSYSQFFTIYSFTLLVATFFALLILIGWKDMDIRKALRSVRYNAIYIVILIVFPMFIQMQDIVERSLTGPGEMAREITYTNWVFSLSGGVIRILQDRLNYQILTDFFIIMYAWVFAFLTYFAPILLLSRDDNQGLRKYAIAIMLNYLILTPFYALFPVSVSSSYPDSGMIPALYADTYWGHMVTSVDPLNNDFPSGHVSLSVTTFLVFATGGLAYRKFSYFLGVATISIVFAVLYLGIHWPADVFAGFLVAIAATVAARSDRIQMTIDRWVRALTDRLLAPEKDGRPRSRP